MSASAKALYSPRILQPRLRKPQPACAAVYLVQSEKDQNRFYFVWMMHDGYLRCECKQATYQGDCKHKDAVKARMSPHQPLCAMCQQEPATDFSEQPRCAACVRICERYAARKHERLASLPRTLAQVQVSEEQKLARQAERAEAERQQSERAAKREAAILQTDDRPFSIYKSA